MEGFNKNIFNANVKQWNVWDGPSWQLFHLSSTEMKQQNMTYLHCITHTAYGKMDTV